MKLSSVITEARRLLQDNTVPYRYSDAVLLGFANQALKRMAVLRPDLFAYLTTIPTVAGTNIQSIPSDGIRIMEIFQVSGGQAVTEASRESLDETYPGWMNVDAGECVNWIRHTRNQTKFFIYPSSNLYSTIMFPGVKTVIKSFDVELPIAQRIWRYKSFISIQPWPNFTHQSARVLSTFWVS